MNLVISLKSKLWNLEFLAKQSKKRIEYIFNYRITSIFSDEIIMPAKIS